MRFLSVTEARRQLPSLVGSSQRTVVTRNGQPHAVLLSYDDYLSLDVLRSLARRPGELARIERESDAFQTGRLAGFFELTSEGELVAAKEAPEVTMPPETAGAG